ncbi:hypothetical protein EZS27_014617 [termite gut metagenome]|uniref:Terminase large subunit gp17-like C-terminal domain-containing protein n=1 Tax=termite gut metagenome TaxID=433724 RepID=A0A5J4RUA4_9ZZZZ
MLKSPLLNPQHSGRKKKETYELPNLKLPTGRHKNILSKRADQINEKVERFHTNVELFKPHSGQKDILKFIITDKKVKYITLVCGRRFGKSVLSCNVSLYFALMYSHSEVMYITPSYRLSKVFFELVCSAIGEKFPFLKKNGINKSDFKISFTNDSYIQFYSGGDSISQNLRGLSCNRLMVIDESSLISNETWENVLSPILLNTEKILAVGTPLSKQSWFYKLYLKSLSGDPKYKSFHKPTSSNPLISSKEIMERKKDLPDAVFRRELLAEFMEFEDVSVFKNYMNCVIPKSEITMTGVKYYFGLDIAKKNDYTALVGINSLHQLVYCNRWNSTSYHVITQNVVNVLHNFRPQDTWIETNSIGDIFFENLREKYDGKLTSFYTLNANKKEIVEQLIVDFEKEDIKIFDYEPLVTELGNFGMEFSSSKRNVIYRAYSGHDDLVMASCFANMNYHTHVKHSKLSYYISKKK